MGIRYELAPLYHTQESVLRSKEKEPSQLGRLLLIESQSARASTAGLEPRLRRLERRQALRGRLQLLAVM